MNPSGPARRVWRCVIGLALAGLCGQAGAASLQVSPVSVSLAANRNADGLTLSNTGAASVHAQVRVFVWTQQHGEDRLDPTRDIAISPPMLEIAPGGSQLIRVIRLGPPPDTERSYRLLVDELPVAPGSDASGPADTRPGLRFMLRYSIPVFLLPVNPAEAGAVLRTRIGRSADTGFIEIANAGSLHAQVADLAFMDGGGQRRGIAAGLAGYVLPGQTRRWPLPATVTTPDRGAFVARINGEPAERALPLDPPLP